MTELENLKRGWDWISRRLSAESIEDTIMITAFETYKEKEAVEHFKQIHELPPKAGNDKYIRKLHEKFLKKLQSEKNEANAIP